MNASAIALLLHTKRLIPQLEELQIRIIGTRASSRERFVALDKYLGLMRKIVADLEEEAALTTRILSENLQNSFPDVPHCKRLILRDMRCETMRDVARISKRDLLEQKGIGPATLRRIEQRLAEFHVRLGMSDVEIDAAYRDFLNTRSDRRPNDRPPDMRKV